MKFCKKKNNTLIVNPRNRLKYLKYIMSQNGLANRYKQDLFKLRKEKTARELSNELAYWIATEGRKLWRET